MLPIKSGFLTTTLLVSVLYVLKCDLKTSFENFLIKPIFLYIKIKVTIIFFDVIKQKLRHKVHHKVGDKHKLTPSVYAVCNVLHTGKVSYSGDTYIRLRSAKHETSTVFEHFFDIEELFASGSIKKKPIFVMETDGAADQAPR